MEKQIWQGVEPSFWRRLADMSKPLVLYGMGDGADKVIAQLKRLGLSPHGIFASDEFVRGQQFAGMTVLTYQAARQQFGDMCVLVCFGTEQPEVLAKIAQIAQEQEVYAPHVPLFGTALFDEAFVAEHEAELLAADALWADDFSRQVYRNYLAYMWTGRVDYLFRSETAKLDAWQELSLTDNEVFLDLGAYDGDTAAEFAALTGGQYQAIWALEPDPKNFAKLQRRLADMPRAKALQMAAWRQSGSLSFAGKAGRNSALYKENNEQAKVKPSAVSDVQTISLDDLWQQFMQGNPPTMIKMDVEGAEEAVLQGAAALLAAHRPRLAVSAYHRTQDIFRLPLLINRLNPVYRLALRHHPYIPGWETNIYAK